LVNPQILSIGTGVFRGVPFARIYSNFNINLSGHSLLNQAYLPNASVIDAYQFSGCTSLSFLEFSFSRILDNHILTLSSITYIGSKAFESVNINTVILSSSTIVNETALDNIDGRLTVDFRYTAPLTFSMFHSIYIQEHIDMIIYNTRVIVSTSFIDLTTTSFTELTESVFNNSPVVNASLPTTLTSLPTGLFQNSLNLKLAIIPSRITSLPDNLFSGCSSLTQIQIRYFDMLQDGPLDLNGFNEIGSNAFISIESIKIVVLPASITINDKSFGSLTN
jgi:hypothetical protein